MKGEVIIPYLNQLIENDGSDLFITVGCPPSLRIGDKIVAMNVPSLEVEDIEAFVEDILTEDQQDDFESTLELNIAFALDDGERFRINLFKQKHSTGMVIRRIRSVIPSLSDLSLPSAYADFIMQKRGLVIMVGATGSGKSTSLASMLDYRNTMGNGHIITIEDPIEFYHSHKSCIITQREVGIDTYSYGIALKNALRQSPDVLMIGEIRDRETLENAILFCETGHLVVATLHANNANQAIERIINLFPEEQHHQIQSVLSLNLKSVISQRLVEGTQKSRVLAYEILINEGLIRSLIEDGKIKELKDVMEKNVDQGMITFDQCLYNFVLNGTISLDVALRESDNPSNLRLRITQHQAASLRKPELDDDESRNNAIVNPLGGDIDY